MGLRVKSLSRFSHHHLSRIISLNLILEPQDSRS